MEAARVLHALDPNAAIELLIKKVRETKTNAEFLRRCRRTRAEIAARGEAHWRPPAASRASGRAAATV